LFLKSISRDTVGNKKVVQIVPYSNEDRDSFPAHHHYVS
jgi:hypothetical protein